MIAAFVVLATLALTSGLRGERTLLFLKRMALKWLTVGLIYALLAVELFGAEINAPNLGSAATFLLVLALGVSITCAMLGFVFYVWGRIAHRTPKESPA